MATEPEQHPGQSSATDDSGEQEVERVTLRQAIVGWRTKEGKTFSERTLQREVAKGNVKRELVDGRVLISVNDLDEHYVRAPARQELAPSEVADTLAHALLLDSGLITTGLIDVVVECFQQTRQAEHAANRTQLDLLHDRLTETEIHTQKLRIENESLAANLKQAEILSIERGATITCLKTEIDLRADLRRTDEARTAVREVSHAQLHHEVAALGHEVAALRETLTKRRWRLIRRS